MNMEKTNVANVLLCHVKLIITQLSFMFQIMSTILSTGTFQEHKNNEK